MADYANKHVPFHSSANAERGSKPKNGGNNIDLKIVSAPAYRNDLKIPKRTFSRRRFACGVTFVKQAKDAENVTNTNRIRIIKSADIRLNTKS